ncbi:hypothetical protein VPH35_090264 [Triticum aestivum]
MAELSLADPAHRPRTSHKVGVSLVEVERVVFFLTQHAVTLRALDGVAATSPMAVGRAFEAQLCVLPCQLRVTAHQPEDFLVVFTQPAHHANAVRRGTLRVDGFNLAIQPWHKDDHAGFATFNLHVRCVIEHMPMQYWSIEGAQEVFGDKVCVDRLDSLTLERGHTKTFACWVWVWDMSFIPTRHTYWKLPRGTGRVEEMVGFSPPDRRVAPPPSATRFDLLIHVDLIEDWSPRSPRSSHSAQSGLPSSGIDDGDALPHTFPGTWTMHVEDGQSEEPHRRQDCAPMVDTGCRGLPLSGPQRDPDNDGADRRSWKDTLLGHGRGHQVQAEVSSKERRIHSRSPPSRHRSGSSKRQGRKSNGNGRKSNGHGSKKSASQDASKATPPPPAPLSSEADLELFFAQAKKPITAMELAKPDAAHIDAEIEAVLDAPLEFIDRDKVQRADAQKEGPDHFGPTLSRPSHIPASFNCKTPTTAATVQMQLGEITEQVLRTGQIQGNLHAASVSECSSGAQNNTTPVAERATLRLVKGLGMLGPKEKMTAKAAEALIHRFDEPLSDDDINVIAKLTRLNKEALHVAVGMAGPEAEAEEAAV